MKLDGAMLRSAVVFYVTGREDPRQPLCAGHPDTWGLLTRGTILENEVYPHPTFLDRRDDAAWREMIAKASATAT